jgi:hypothetical protein
MKQRSLAGVGAMFARTSVVVVDARAWVGGPSADGDVV